MTKDLPQAGTQTRALYDHLVTGKVYNHSMSFHLGIAGTASPKRLQEAKVFLSKNGYVVYEEKVRTASGKHYIEYKAMKLKPQTLGEQTNLFTTLILLPTQKQTL